MPSFLEDSAVFKSCITKLHDPLFDQLSKIPRSYYATVPIPKTVGSAIHHKTSLTGHTHFRRNTINRGKRLWTERRR